VAWSATAITGDELTAWEFDHPVVIGAHALMDDTASPIWATSQNTGASDSTASGYPTYRASDGLLQASRTTKPSSGLSTWYFAVAFASPAEFDCVMIAGPNVSAASLIEVEIADDATFTTNDMVVAFFSTATADRTTKGKAPLDGDRLFVGLSQFPSSTTWDRFSGVGYLAVKITGSAGFVPELSELWLGRRYQLFGHPDSPTSRKWTRGNIGSTRTSIGASGARVLSKGQAVRDTATTMAKDAEVGGVVQWWADCKYGARDFLWVEDPRNSPAPYVMTSDVEPVLDLPLEGYIRRVWRQRMM
jgi:hypothetical protein